MTHPERPEPADEPVALYDDVGRPAGTATRGRVRAGNLTHAATGVVLRDSWGRVLVHRRTETKDVYPGLLDLAAGGVVDAGEDPTAAAVRELAEELGVAGVPLEPLGVTRYRDDHTDYWAHCFTATWDGPVTLQPEEVAWSDWWPADRVVAALDADPDAWVPDTTSMLGGWLRARAAERVEVAEQGWDSHAEVVEGRWLDRTARREQVAAQLAVECRLMPRLAPLLPLPVPVPLLLETTPTTRVRHRLVPGVAATGSALTADDGRRVGEFLRALHDAPPSTWADTGIGTDADRVPVLAEMAELVLPLLPEHLRADGRALLARVGDASRLRRLRHGDLGPEHLLVDDTGPTGVIDWGDVALGDPALDLAWTLHGTPGAFADALAASYGVTEAERARGRDWHLLGPWWEVHWGMSGGGREYVDSGMAGVLTRLAR